MSLAGAASLLSFIDAPVVVGDPDGRAAYANPCFVERFAVEAEDIRGEPLVNIFEGGVREAVLRAVAEVCQRGRSTRFRVRHAGRGYTGLASPIAPEGEQVGFVIVFFESPREDERVHVLEREIREPTEELARVIEELTEAGRERVDDKVKLLLEDGSRAVARIAKASNELWQLISGQRETPPGFDPAQVLAEVAERLGGEFTGSGVDLETALPERLIPVRGDAAHLREAMVALLRHRLGQAERGAALRLEARVRERDGVPAAVVAVVDLPGGAREADEAEPEAVRRAVASLGGELAASMDDDGRRTTAIRLRGAKQ